MESIFFLNHKIVKFRNVKISTKLWKAQIVLPFLMINNEKVEKDKISVWSIKLMLN